MSMIYCLETASDESISRLLQNPEEIEEWLGFDRDGDEAESESPATDEHIQADLDKAWDAIHFLLCNCDDGTSGPEAFLLDGGETIGDVDVGYGPARAFRSGEVRALSQMLAAIPPDTIRARFDLDKITEAEIYPSFGDADPDAVEYVLEYYSVLRQHMATAAAKGMGMIVYLA